MKPLSFWSRRSAKTRDKEWAATNFKTFFPFDMTSKSARCGFEKDFTEQMTFAQTIAELELQNNNEETVIDERVRLPGNDAIHSGNPLRKLKMVVKSRTNCYPGISLNGTIRFFIFSGKFYRKCHLTNINLALKTS
jgi:hypothetical protein